MGVSKVEYLSQWVAELGAKPKWSQVSPPRLLASRGESKTKPSEVCPKREIRGGKQVTLVECSVETQGYRNIFSNAERWAFLRNEETGNETVGWHHRLNGHESEQTLGDSEGQGNRACCSSWGHRVGHDLVTEQQPQKRAGKLGLQQVNHYRPELSTDCNFSSYSVVTYLSRKFIPL